jgi:tetratricopeptide (TPR) repeat protein/opacity protein-like surface antigen
MRYLIFPLLVLFAPLCWSETDILGKNCTKKYGAQLISLQGKLFFDPDSKGHWQLAQLNETICEGSRVRVEPSSRVSLLLSNGIVLRLDAGTVLSLNGIAPNEPTLLALLRGFVYLISRTPRRLEISSPIANAGPEGTEFAMSVDESNASLWVYEGGVRFFNAQGSINLKPGQSAQAQLGQAPQAHIDMKPQDAVNWALYYPPLLPYPEASTPIDKDMRIAIRDFRQGRIDDALSLLDALSPEKRTLYFFKVRGAMRLIVGQVSLALQDIHALLANNPNDAEALALQSVLALTQNRKDKAYALANRAIYSDPRSATAYSALSYAEQGRFELDKALKAADQAVKFAPHDAMVWARKAELELALRLTSESGQTAQHALKLDDTLERTQTVMGFAYLLRTDTNEALKAFEKAVNLDSTSPLARLGLGLAKIRKGDLKKGRQDLEIAAILDPGNSLVRSYLGKAYYEEKRSSLAVDQFNLAKQRDPKDPTSFFYDAINKQTANRPVEALHDMLKAIELNDNRAVYRSKLLLDADAAARSANLARIYNDLGFGRVALKEAWKSLGYDSANSSAHRFLSDAYVGLPRYRTARASELLQAQLLQPINITPVQPQLTYENISILNSTGPGSLSWNEYDPLYTSNGPHVVLNGAYGSNNTKTDNAIVSGVYNRLSMSLGQFHYQTNGFRKNDDYQQNIYDAFAQYAFTSDFNLQFELKSENVRAGDVPFRLNGFHDKNLRQTIKQDTARVGGHYKISPEQDLITSFLYTSRKDNTTDKLELVDTDIATNIQHSTSVASYQTEIQHTYHPSSFQVITGMGYMNQNTKGFDDSIDSDQTGPFPDSHASTLTSLGTDYFNAYSYLKNQIFTNLTTILGLSFDSFNSDVVGRQWLSSTCDRNNPDLNCDNFRSEPIDRVQFNPKIGVIWSPIKNLTLRSAAFRTLNRPLATNQTIEPTQVAGFNQFFDGNNGSTAWNYGIGLDYNPIQSVFLGGEVTWHNSKQQVPSSSINNLQSRNESSHLAYIYWIPTEWASLKAEYRFDQITKDFVTGKADPTFPQSITTHQVPISLNLFHPTGIFGKVSGTYVNQHVDSVIDVQTEGFNPNFPLSYQSEDFWTFDAAIGYRFPKRYGIISFEVRNLFDNHFKFQSTFDASGPQLTPYVPERQLFVKLSLFY